MTMTNGPQKITLPNPHRGDIDWSLTRRILAQAGIDQGVWKKLGG